MVYNPVSHPFLEVPSAEGVAEVVAQAYCGPYTITSPLFVLKE